MELHKITSDEQHGTAANVSLVERMFGDVNPADPDDVFVKAYEVLTGESLNAEELKRLAAAGLEETERLVRESPDWANNYHPDRVEELYLPSMLNNMFVERQPWDRAYATVLRSFPSYQELYKQRARVAPNTTPDQRKALLIGALTSLSVRAFTVLSEDVFNASAMCIDPKVSDAKRRHNTVEGNILAPPTALANNIDVAVTHRLTCKFVDHLGRVVTPETESHALTKLAEGMFTVLRPGGSLLMNELPPGFDLSDKGCRETQTRQIVPHFDARMEGILRATGFVDIYFQDGTDMAEVDYLFDPKQEFTQYERAHQPWIRTIYARKPIR